MAFCTLRACVRAMVLACAFAAAAFSATAAFAGDFTLVPAAVRLDAAERDGNLELTNRGGDAAVFSVKPESWTQDESGDHFGTTTDVLTSPPLFSIDAGATQSIRVALRSFTMGERERAYRFYLRQIAGPAQTATSDLQIAYNLPIFIAPIGPVRITLTARYVRDSPGHGHLLIHNDGNVHVKIADVSLATVANPAKPVVTLAEEATYVLAGATRSITVTVPNDVDRQPLTATFHDDRDRTFLVPLDRE